jgi:hypothetical protein
MRFRTTVIAFALCLGSIAAGPATRPTSRPVPSEADVAVALAKANDLGRESPQFPGVLQSVAGGFRAVEVNTTPGQARWQRVTLNRLGKKVDAVRFRTPPADAKNKPADMSWAFAFPKDSVQVWYICPVEGQMQGFQNFFRLKPGALKNTDVPADHGVIAQRLAANRLKPDTEYILWFTFANDRPADVHVAVSFVPTKGSNEKATLDALGLTYVP